MLMMGMAMIGEHEKRLVPLEDRAPMRHTLRLGLFLARGSPELQGSPQGSLCRTSHPCSC